MGHIASDCPHRRIVTIQDQKEILFEEKEGENEEDQTDFEEFEEQYDVGDLLVVRRALTTSKSKVEESQSDEHIQISSITTRPQFGFVIKQAMEECKEDLDGKQGFQIWFMGQRRVDSKQR